MSSSEAYTPSRKRRKTTKPRRTLPACTRCAKLKARCDDLTPCYRCEVYEETCTRPPRAGPSKGPARAGPRVLQTGHAPTYSRPSERPSSFIQNGLPTPTDGHSVTSRVHDTDESDSSGLRSVVYSNTPLNNDEDDSHGRPSTTVAVAPQSFRAIHDSDHANVSQTKNVATSAAARVDNKNSEPPYIPPYIPVLPPNAANHDRSTSKMPSPGKTTNAVGRAELKGLGITLQGSNNDTSPYPRSSIWTSMKAGSSTLEPASTTSVYGAAVREWQNIPMKRERIDDDDYDDDSDDSTLSDLPEYMYEISADHTLLGGASKDVNSKPNNTEQAQQEWFGKPIKAEPIDYGYGSASPLMRESMDRTPIQPAVIKAAISDDEHDSGPSSPTRDIKTAAPPEQDDIGPSASNHQPETSHETHAHRTTPPVATDDDEATSQPQGRTSLTDDAAKAIEDYGGLSYSKISCEVAKAIGDIASTEPLGQSALPMEQEHLNISIMHKPSEVIEPPHDPVPAAPTTSTAGPGFVREPVHPAEQNDSTISDMHEPPEMVELPQNTPALALPASNAFSEPARNAIGPIEQNDHLRTIVTDCLKGPGHARNTADAELSVNEPAPKLVSAATAAPQKRGRPASLVVDGAVACQNCGTTITSKWRHGDNGHTFCNACGLSYRYQTVRRSMKKSTDEQVRAAKPAAKKSARTSRAATEDTGTHLSTSIRKARNALGIKPLSDDPAVANSAADSQIARGVTVGPIEQNISHTSIMNGWHNVTRDTFVQNARIHEARNTARATSQSASPALANDTASSQLAKDTAIPIPTTVTSVEPSGNTAVAPANATLDTSRSHTAAPSIRTSFGASSIDVPRIADSAGTSGQANTSGPALDNRIVGRASNTNPADPYFTANTASPTCITSSPDPAHVANTLDCSISLDVTSGTARIVNHTTPTINLHTPTDHAGHTTAHEKSASGQTKTTGKASRPRLKRSFDPACEVCKRRKVRCTHTDVAIATGDGFVQLSPVERQSFAIEIRDDDDHGTTNTAGRSCNAKASSQARVTNSASASVRQCPPSFQVYTHWLGSSSPQVYTHWLEMALCIPSQGLTDDPKSNVGYGDALEVLSEPYMPKLPTIWPALLDAFFSSVAGLFPMVDQASLKTQAERLERLDDRALRNLETHERPTIAILYGCFAVGAQHLGHTDLVRHYLSAASSLVAFLVAFPSLQSARALLVLVLGLRAQDKNGAAYHVLGVAISTLQSLGAQRRPFQNRPIGSLEIDSRVRWSAYCLDRMMSIETGRPSRVHDGDMDQDELRRPDLLQVGSESLFLLLAAQLARIQGHVSLRLFSAREPPPCPRAILNLIWELDEELLRWKNELPWNLHPDNEILTGDPSIMAVQCYFALQFHLTLATVHRSALLMSRATNLAVLERCPDLKQSAPRLRSSEQICAVSARRVIGIFQDAHEMDMSTPLIPATQVLQAVYVLTIHTLRNPSSYRARNDLNLVYHAAYIVQATRNEAGLRSDRLLPLLLRFTRNNCGGIMTRLSTMTQRQVQTHKQAVQQHRQAVRQQHQQHQQYQQYQQQQQQQQHPQYAQQYHHNQLPSQYQPQYQPPYQPQYQPPQQPYPFRQTIDLTSDAPAMDPHAAVWNTLYPFMFQGDMRIDPGYRPSEAQVCDWLGIPQLTEQELRVLHAVQ